jgi:hypothetical protein
LNNINITQQQQQQALQQQQQQQQQQQPPPNQQAQSPSQMLAGLGMVPPTQMDPYYYLNQQSVYPRQPVRVI